MQTNGYLSKSLDSQVVHELVGRFPNSTTRLILFQRKGMSFFFLVAIIYKTSMAKKLSRFLSGKRIDPTPISKKMALADLIDESFMAYNAARLREACQLFTRKM